MKSENYRQLLNNEFESQEMTKEDFDNTLMHFAMLFHKEQSNLVNPVAKRDIKFTHGFITSIAGDGKGGEACIVTIDGEDLHPVNASILAINCGYRDFKEMTEDYSEDFEGCIDDDFNITTNL